MDTIKRPLSLLLVLHGLFMGVSSAAAGVEDTQASQTVRCHLTESDGLLSSYYVLPSVDSRVHAADVSLTLPPACSAPDYRRADSYFTLLLDEQYSPFPASLVSTLTTTSRF